MRTLATFWHGAPLAPLDQACLLSFVRHGFEVHIYSYDDIGDIHPDLRRRDATEIIDQSYTKRFRIAGQPSLSHFSDMFRYQLFRLTDHTWIDTDLFCLKAFDIPTTGHFLTRETLTSLNGAISRLDRADPMLDRIIADVETLADQDLLWGATGPHLITKRLGNTALTTARPSNDFYPFHWDEWYRPFIRNEQDRCVRDTSDSFAVHLWNNILVKAGYWKDLAPPSGSFLHSSLDQLDLLPLFKATLPNAVMENLAMNHLNLHSGSHLPIAKLSKLLARRLALATARHLTSAR